MARCGRSFLRRLGEAARGFFGSGHEKAATVGQNRRDMLKALGALPVVGAAAYPLLPDQPVCYAAPRSDDTLSTKRDIQEHARLKALNLDDPQAKSRREKMPVGKIGDLTLGRLVCGSNLISMNMHSRDLKYVYSLARHYNTEERIFMTMKKCEELGINSIVLKHSNFKQFQLGKYWDEWGGKMKWIAHVITTDVKKFGPLLEEHIDLGASAAYVWGGASDIWYNQKKPGNIIKAYEQIRKHNLVAGVAAHRIEPIMFCEKEGIKPDFYMLTLHHDRYWSAHPEENRRFIEMFRSNSPNHAEYHDNLFCHKHERVVEYMQQVKVPWIAFKVLAAGAIPPKDGLKYAFDSGADFICLGMFDFQVQEDALLTQKLVAGAKNRTRPWA